MQFHGPPLASLPQRYTIWHGGRCRGCAALAFSEGGKEVQTPIESSYFFELCVCKIGLSSGPILMKFEIFLQESVKNCTLISHFSLDPGGRRPPDAYRGFATGPHWRTFAPTPWLRLILDNSWSSPIIPAIVKSWVRLRWAGWAMVHLKILAGFKKSSGAWAEREREVVGAGT